MPAFDVLDALVRGGNGVLRTADAVAAGITRPVLGNYVRERGLERVGHGLYLAPDAWKDGDVPAPPALSAGRVFP